MGASLSLFWDGGPPGITAKCCELDPGNHHQFIIQLNLIIHNMTEVLLKKKCRNDARWSRLIAKVDPALPWPCEICWHCPWHWQTSLPCVVRFTVDIDSQSTPCISGLSLERRKRKLSKMDSSMQACRPIVQLPSIDQDIDVEEAEAEASSVPAKLGCCKPWLQPSTQHPSRYLPPD